MAISGATPPEVGENRQANSADDEHASSACSRAACRISIERGV
jgi:hypothetical protein